MKYLQNSIAKQSADADAVLENCKSFCINSAASGNYEHMATAFKFVRKTCGDDHWLLASARIILPCLGQAYGKILSTADPNKRSSPGRVSVAITPTIQESKEALHGLCSIFELCIDLCDVADPETEKHLGLFLRSSAAVLFGSNFEQHKDTLTDTDYAMDELARYSSYALCNILIEFPALVRIADDLLGKRTLILFNILYSSPEMSIQRSLVLILRVMYENASKRDASPRNLKRQIENGLSATRFGNGRALELFKAIEIDGSNVEEEGERVIMKMCESEELDSRCFSCECNVRMSGKVNGRIKKGGTQKAKVDWNKNSIVIHVKNQIPAYFALYAITNMKWMSGRKEVRLTLSTEGNSSETQLAIELKPGNRGMLAGAIERRINYILSMASTSEKSFITNPTPDSRRKLSAGWRQQRGNSEVGGEGDAGEERSDDDEGDVDNQGNSDSDCKLGLGNDVSDGDEPWSNANGQEENVVLRPEIAEKDDEQGPTVFSIIDADGILLVDKPPNDANKIRSQSAESEETKEDSKLGSDESNEIVEEEVIESPQPDLPQTPTRAVPHKRKLDNCKPRGNPEVNPENAVGEEICVTELSLCKEDNYDCESSVPNGDLTPKLSEQAPSICEEELNPNELLGNCADDDKSGDITDIDDEQDDPDYDGGSDVDVVEPSDGFSKQKRAVLDPENRGQLEKRGGSDFDRKTNAINMGCGGLEESQASNLTFCEDDEGIREKLLSAVRELMKVR